MTEEHIQLYMLTNYSTNLSQRHDILIYWITVKPINFIVVDVATIATKCLYIFSYILETNL